MERMARMSFNFQLAHYEEEYAPPELPVLDVTVVGTVVFLDICEYEESRDSRVLNVIASVAVDGEALTQGLSTSALEFQRSLKRSQKRNAERESFTKAHRGEHRFLQNPNDPTEGDCALCGVEKDFHGDAGRSEETCIRCGWRMGNPALNCNNDNTAHVFPSQLDKVEVEIPLHECGSECADDPI
jgi:hypothetical protein